ncbi:histone H2A-Bbd type 2/3-like [Meriones unguiculatus]|uniref:histone H2A-Bbd type 2/3-like n=1 Tax=Meriones unguiculatus TaxID=10047 RepID=UPI00293F3E91|nr:histone H2A-Bbd type 2/3-like [Meriones unguiculatus]XP_060230719.1 histone H2A-Bbd type 2/3-like [Meriones unguiculatus]XP_060230721.1 histone H2A-Bbd type 2/3-like [Meriones unguiculatus]XP_060230723.1 histone H2A-Bbd type 2/3-like [Meriones unguiculatus]
MPRRRQRSSRGSSSRRSRTSRAGLTFSVSLVEHHLREGGYGRRLSESVSVYLTAILEFLARSLLDLASNEVQRQDNERLITPELLDLAIYNDALLSELFQFITISHVTPGQRSGRSRLH